MKLNNDIFKSLIESWKTFFAQRYRDVELVVKPVAMISQHDFYIKYKNGYQRKILSLKKSKNKRGGEGINVSAKYFIVPFPNRAYVDGISLNRSVENFLYAPELEEIIDKGFTIKFMYRVSLPNGDTYLSMIDHPGKITEKVTPVEIDALELENFLLDYFEEEKNYDGVFVLRKLLDVIKDDDKLKDILFDLIQELYYAKTKKLT